MWIQLALFTLIIGIDGRPSISQYFPAVFGGRDSISTPPIKIFTGTRIRNDSQIHVYVHDQTVAVIEIANQLLNCELIEIIEPEQIEKAIGNWGKQLHPIEINFGQMLSLMSKCQEVEKQRNSREEDVQADQPPLRGFLSSFSLFSGIIPGTKWCGTGDIADNYHDLGPDEIADKCCRAHDLCPVKVRARSNKYNLTNNAIYTKSHCKCDDNLYKCLKDAGSYAAQVIGNIYFNIVQASCVEDSQDGREFRNVNEDYWFQV